MPVLHRRTALLGIVTSLVLASGCRAPAAPAAAPSTTALAFPAAIDSLYDPARDLGPLFHDVQLARVFPDSKTFVDAKPRSAPADIVARYREASRTAQPNLKAFVAENFDTPTATGEGVRTDTTQTMEEHVRALWPALTRAADVVDPRSSLIPLPTSYVVPGGRFREVYYWDSYFTMQGLVESGRTDLVKGMLDNFAHLVSTVGHIPNANRTYYLSRSQPPYFAAMVGLYATATDTARAVPYLDALEQEHAFWMEGAAALAPGEAHRRVVRLRDGTLLNRYWDDRPEPRPESYREDYQLAQTVPPAQREALYRNIRASAESGWDFSSRWMRDPKDLRTLETVDLVPVDLNALLYHAERTIAALRAFRGRAGDGAVAAQYLRAAEERRRALMAVAYDPGEGYFFDVRWRTGERVTDRLQRDFLKPGGFVTTQIASGQQWDAPNGWPPLQWLAIQGVTRYGRGDIAEDARNRWLALNRRTYRVTGKMTEKYDVSDLSKRAGGGEYPTQDGFGWTNGVALGLAAQERARATPAPARP
jgi:alpha,alpha-trehalase